MEEPTSAHPDPTPAVKLGVEARTSGEARRKTPVLPLFLGAFGLLAGLGAVGVVAWSAAETDREILRLSTELAQLRVSLDLYAQSNSGAGSLSSEALADLGNRLDALEQDALTATVPTPTPAATLPPIAPSTTASGEDCLPAGMRLLVAMGDSYAVCGQTAVVDVAMVDNGYITLSDGTTIPSGGTLPLPNSDCTIGVTSSGDEGLTGYAEIRVSC